MALDTLFFLALASGFAGFVDAVVGGGGLVLIPVLFSALPGESTATLFGTNKCAAVVGTSNAAWRYARSVTMPWRATLPAAAMAFGFSFLGAKAVAWLPKATLQPMILLLLIGSAVYTFLRKDFGALHRPAHTGGRELLYALTMGAAIGFYDGFFGPGTGSFLIFLFIRFFGFDFLHASAAAKVVNVATNLAALAFFVPHGYWLPWVALIMAVANVLGSLVGTRIALRGGSRLIRKIFLVVVCALILRFAWTLLLEAGVKIPGVTG